MRGLKIFAIIFILVFCVLAAATYYLNTYFIPGPFKNILINKAKDILSRDVTIQELGFNITQGIVLKGIQISDHEGEQHPFLTVKEISLGMPLPDFLRSGNIVIPFANIREPIIHITRLNDQQWNFSDLFPPAKTEVTQKDNLPKSAPKKSKVTIAIANIEHGQIEITDLRSGSTQTEILKDLDVSAHLALQGGFDFDVSFVIPAHITSFRIHGHFSPAGKDLVGILDAKNLDIGYFINLAGHFARMEFHQLILDNAHLAIKAKGGDFDLQGYATSPLDLTIKNNTLVRIKATPQFNNLFIKKTAELFKINCDLKSPALLMNIDADKTLSGIPAIKNLAVAIQLGKSISAEGDVELNTALYTVGDNQKFMGNFTGTNVFFQYIGNEVNLRGNFTGQDSQMLLAHTKLRGDLVWNKAYYKKEGANLTMSGYAKMPRGIFQNESLDVSGELNALPFILNKDAATLDLTIPLCSTNNITILSGGKKIISSIVGRNVGVNYTNHILKTNGQIKTKNLKITGKNNFSYTGNPDITFQTTNDPALKAQSFSFNGTAILDDDTLQGLPKVSELNHLKGRIAFNTDELTSENLNFTYGATPISISGSLKNFKTPSAKISAKTENIDLSLITPFFADKLNTVNLNISGQAQHASFSYDGVISSSQSANVKAAAYIKGAEIAWDKLSDKITHFQGSLDYENHGLSWEDLMFSYKGQDYTANGSVSDFQKLTIDTTLRNKDFDLTVQGNREEEHLTIQSLKGKYHNTTFDLKGSAGLQEGFRDVDVTGQMNLDLSDLAVLFPSIGEKIKILRPSGILALDGRVHLPALPLLKMKASFKATSPQISLWGYDFKKLSADVTSLEDHRQGITINTNIYNGKLEIDGKMVLDESNIPLEMTMDITDLDLAQLKNDIPAMKAKEFSGLLTLHANANGPLSSPKELQGSGTVQVKDGHLLELNLLRGIWKYLLIKNYENIVFTEAHANFKVANNKITTDDLIIKSSAVDLDASGSLTLDGNLDFYVGANVHEAPILTSDVRGTPTALIAEAQKYMAIKLTGTVSNPQYKVKPLPLKAIGNTTGSIIHGIQGMLEDVLQ